MQTMTKRQGKSGTIDVEALLREDEDMGQLDEARKIVQRLRTLSPVVVPPAVPFRKEEDRELFLSGLRLAAGEET
jgi:hypothetical protein